MSGRDFLVGLVAGLVAAIIWTVVWTGLVEFWRRRRLRKDFQPLSGVYQVARKGAAQLEPETVSITVRRNVLRVEFDASGHLVSSPPTRLLSGQCLRFVVHFTAKEVESPRLEILRFYVGGIQGEFHHFEPILLIINREARIKSESIGIAP